MDAKLPATSVAQHLAERIATLRADTLPAAVKQKCEDLLIDVAGLCVTARNEDYVTSALAGCDDDGPCTAIGHARTLSSASAAFINGTAAHGEDFDDTFEGGPVHAGAVIVPAVLAACERHGRDGQAALLGIAIGTEVMCRLSLVTPKLVHKAGFHPTAIFGVMGAAAGVSASLGLNAKQTVDALGIAGSFASGIIEYLTDGAWTKRLHPGWAAQSGIRAALLARGGFFGPRTVFEGIHGLFHGFARTTQGNYEAVTGDFGTNWVTETLAFKPYPCGTMAHPYIDCAKRLAARGIKAADIKEMVCEVAEGTVHRLWEPLAVKQRPPNGYAAKFATPFILATGFVKGGVGLGDFTPEAVRDPDVLALAAKVRFVIDPNNPYPSAFTGHIRCVLKDGTVIEERQPHFRGGANEPLTRADIEEKFALNAKHGGWDDKRSAAALALLAKLYSGKIDLASLRGINMANNNQLGDELKGKVAIVTGAGRNIGRAIALQLAQAGAAVIVNVKSNKAEADAVVAEIEKAGGQAIAVLADVADASAMNALAEAAMKKFGRIDCLVNNASLRREKSIVDMSYDEWREVMDVTLDSAFHGVKACLPAMEKAGSGTIINVGGMSAHIGSKGRAHVMTAKAGLTGFTRGLAHDLAALHITANCVVPGAIDTTRPGSSQNPAHHLTHGTITGERGKPYDVAAMIRFLCGPGGRYVTGQTIHINGGAYLGV